MSVPTWNYVAVHAYGVPRLIEDGPALRSILAQTVQIYEAGLVPPWSLERLPDAFVGKLVKAIVGFEICLTRLEGKWKLNQNRSAADRRRVAAALRETDDPLGIAVAEIMAAPDSAGE